MNWIVKVRAGGSKNCITFTLDIEATTRNEARQKALREAAPLADRGERLTVVQVIRNG
jgi:hypothetical protein